MSALATAYGRMAPWWREIVGFGLSVAVAALLGLWLVDWRADDRAAKMERALILEKLGTLEKRENSRIGGLSTLREKLAIIAEFSRMIDERQRSSYPVMVQLAGELADEIAAREAALKPKAKAKRKKAR